MLPQDLPKPANEFQIRPFLKLEPDEFPQKWQTILDAAGAGKVTSRIVEETLQLPKRKRKRRNLTTPDRKEKFNELLDSLRAALEEKNVEDAMREPNGRGVALSMAKAVADAGLAPGDIDCVNAHGTGTPKNDIAETQAIKQTLGARAPVIPVTDKSMTGHLIATSGALEAIASAMTLYARKVPPTINLVCADPQCDLDYVADGCRGFAGRTVLSNSFGFWGQTLHWFWEDLTPAETSESPNQGMCRFSQNSLSVV